MNTLSQIPAFNFIQTDAELARICALAAQQDVIALDTEFMRVSSFFPKLGLIQLFDGERISLIDPLAINDFSPFADLLKNPNVIKVLHACSEDLTVFLQEFHCLPTPMIDTQIMAHFLLGENACGLAKLVLRYFHLEIDKSATRTNWLKRPLSDVQLRYAAGDVWYLLPLYQKMREELAQTPWQQAVIDDCNFMLNQPHAPNTNAENAYLDIPNAWKLNPLELARLRILAKWRMETAIERNIALNFVTKADSLWLLAKHNPHNTTEMLEIGVNETDIRVRGKKLLWLLAQTRKVSPSDFPKRLVHAPDLAQFKQAMQVAQSALTPLLLAGLPKELIASKRDLESLVKWHLGLTSPEKLPKILQNWREPIGFALLKKIRAL